jgi:peroxiredoxin (alkyl hydroperoxide reductase subunit C)
MTMRRATALAGLALLALAIHVSTIPVAAQVLGPCGTSAENDAAPAEMPATAGGAVVPDRIPLPGERARNFELQAVVGDEIKMVKLSDYNGTWRVLCFYPADFTFV